MSIKVTPHTFKDMQSSTSQHVTQSEAKKIIEIIYRDLHHKGGDLIYHYHAGVNTNLFCSLIHAEFPRLEGSATGVLNMATVRMNISQKSHEVLYVYKCLYTAKSLEFSYIQCQEALEIFNDLKCEFPNLNVVHCSRAGLQHVLVSFKVEDSSHQNDDSIEKPSLQIKVEAKKFIKQIYEHIFKRTSMTILFNHAHVSEIVTLLKAEFPHLCFNTDSYPGVIVSLGQIAKTPEVLSVYEKLFRDGKVTFAAWEEKVAEIYESLTREFPHLKICKDLSPQNLKITILTVQFSETTETPIPVICPYQAHKDKMAKNQLIELENLIDLNGEKCIYETMYQSSSISPENTEKMEKYGYKITKSPTGLTLTWKWVPNSAHSDKLEKFQLEELKKLIGVGCKKCVYKVSLPFQENSTFLNITDSNIKEMEKYGYEWTFRAAASSRLTWIK